MAEVSEYATKDRCVQPSAADDKSYQIQHMVIHRVICHLSQDDPNHGQHPSEQDYFDVPRLLANANQISALQGQRRLENLDWYFEDYPSVSFAVVNIYKCKQYHEEISDQFSRSWIPPTMPEHIAAQARPYFSFLPRDAKEATRTRQMIVPSTTLSRAMQILHSHYPIELDDWDDEQNLTYPYLQLWHIRKSIPGTAQSYLTPAQQEHIDNLLSYLDEHLTTEYEDAEDLFATGLTSRRHWGKMFRPDDLVVTMVDGEPLAYLCKACPVLETRSLVLECWSWEFDGKFHRSDSSLTVEWPSQSETTSIMALPYYPLRFDRSGLAEKLERRGRMFWSCRKKRYISYDVSLGAIGVHTTNLRYMVDTETYKIMHPQESEAVPQDALDDESMLNDEPPTAPEQPFFLYLLPAKLRGFGLHNKKWNELLVEHIHEIVWDKDVFNHNLVLDDGKKELVEALVSVHLERDVSTKADFMAGKGEGLLILLHGGPGTGKTLTAESVAEIAERPLYRVTCGDIGTNPEEVEKYLNSVLFIGTTWNCVVLLDEADVFLEERTKLDMERNALVSVFLRVLEYYDGILILTSNRIGTFDEAFKSRVQLSLHYPPLKQANRLRIWENFIALLREGDSTQDYKDIRSRLDSLSQHKLNGRQIRNTVNTARQLAQFRKTTLQYKHLDQAIQNVIEFENYVTRLHDGQNDEEYAEAAGIRHSNKKRKAEADPE